MKKDGVEMRTNQMFNLAKALGVPIQTIRYFVHGGWTPTPPNSQQRAILVGAPEGGDKK